MNNQFNNNAAEQNLSIVQTIMSKCTNESFSHYFYLWSKISFCK